MVGLRLYLLCVLYSVSAMSLEPHPDQHPRPYVVSQNLLTLLQVLLALRGHGRVWLTTSQKVLRPMPWAKGPSGLALGSCLCQLQQCEMPGSDRHS